MDTFAFRCRWIGRLMIIGAATLPLWLGEAAFSQGAQDFFSNTQSANRRADPGTADAALPGFNPCPGGTRDSAGSCTGGSGLLRPENLTRLFPSLGTGSVTDNMFGVIAATDDPNCARNDTAASMPNGLQLGLSCGFQIRTMPATQGMRIPETRDSAGNPINTLTDPFTLNTSFHADFCASGRDDCGSPQLTAAHVGFDVTQSFSWTPLSSADAEVRISQRIRQVTGLNPNDAIGSVMDPGPGDQQFDMNFEFTPFTSFAAGGFEHPIITWTQTLVDPNLSGTGEAFRMSGVTGAFEIEGNPLMPIVSYPSGPSQTARSQGEVPVISDQITGP